jgi:hypothetical protein
MGPKYRRFTVVSRADDLRAAQEAELAVVELEDQLAAEKNTKKGASRETKHALREARQRFRDLRGGGPVAEGDAVASPGAVQASANVEGVG